MVMHTQNLTGVMPHGRQENAPELPARSSSSSLQLVTIGHLKTSNLNAICLSIS